MNKFERDSLKIRIIKLAMLKSTGTPAEMASKFEISQRSVKRLVKEIRDDGYMISFNRLRQTYVVEKSAEFMKKI